VELHCEPATSGNVQPEEGCEERPNKSTKVTGGRYTTDVVPTKIEVKGGITPSQ